MEKENPLDNIQVTTTTRDDALQMAAFLARGFEPRFFHDPDKVPVVVVTGTFNDGKCKICEAMSREILDQESIEEMMREGADDHHYLEKRPCHALEEYLYQRGTIAGVPAVVSFDRISMQEESAINLDETMHDNFTNHTQITKGELKEGYRISYYEPGYARGPQGNYLKLKDAFLHGTASIQKFGGAIFTSGRGDLDQDIHTKWLHVHIDQEWGSYCGDYRAAGKYAFTSSSNPAFADDEDVDLKTWEQENNKSLAFMDWWMTPDGDPYYNRNDAFAAWKDTDQYKALVEAGEVPRDLPEKADEPEEPEELAPEKNPREFLQALYEGQAEAINRFLVENNLAENLETLDDNSFFDIIEGLNEDQIQELSSQVSNSLFSNLFEKINSKRDFSYEYDQILGQAPHHPKWTKTFTITAHAPELQNSPRFQAYWKALKNYAETGQLIEPDIKNSDIALQPEI
jgi:hypothetical protein